MDALIVKPNSPGTQGPSHSVARLSLIVDMLRSFHDLNIKYCHWKSNEHLAASMVGNTDLDILFENQSKTHIEIILNNYGFKHFVSTKERQYKDIEDFIGLDLESGKIVHVHAHFKLTLGESYLKGYQLNLEEKILDSRVFDIEFGIYRSAPAFELMLLYFRHALKIRNRDILRFYFKNNIRYSGNVLAEYHWLKKRCTNKEIEVLLKSLFPDYSPLYNLLTEEFSYEVMLKLSDILNKAFKHQRLYSPLKATLLRWYREITVKLSRKWSTISSQPIVSQRVHPRKGLTIAIIGADGSGKSTVIRNLHATFKKKIDVYSLYLGKGKSGDRSWLQKMLTGVKKYSKVQKRQKKVDNQDLASQNGRSFKFNLFKCMEALVVARVKLNKLNMMKMAKAKGMLVVCDRFPQNQLMGYNDGPALNYLLHSKNNRLFKTLAKTEAKMYQQAEDQPPDIIFKLLANVDVIAARKPSCASLEMLESKIEGIKQLKFLPHCDVVTIDANQPLDEVLRAIKGHIWGAWA